MIVDGVMGVDPGKSGGFSIIHSSGVYQCPVTEDDATKQIIISPMVEFLKLHRDKIKIAYLEDVHAIYGCGARSTFEFGRSKGIKEGIMSTLSIPIVLVKVRDWQKQMWRDIDNSLKDPKAKSILSTKLYFPEVNMLMTKRSKVPHLGLVDSLLIAEYGNRQQNKKLLTTL